jgi:O-antigen biosynthesis protein WbqL
MKTDHSSIPENQCLRPQWREAGRTPRCELIGLDSHPDRETAAVLIEDAHAQRALGRLPGFIPPTTARTGDVHFRGLFCVRVKDVTVKGAEMIFINGAPTYWGGIHPPYAVSMFPHDHGGATGRAAESVVHLAGPVAHLGHWTAHIYGHFLLEMLPKVVAFHRLKAVYPDMKLLVSNWATESMLGLLRLFVPESDLLIYDAPTQQIEVSRLFLLPSLFQDRAFHPAMDNFLAFAGRQAKHRTTAAPRIFVSKSKWRRAHPGDYRRLTNEAEVRHLLEQRGFLTVFPEEMSAADQIAVFAGAKVIVGEYGSALHNAIFAPTGTVVISLNCTNVLQDCIAAYAGHTIGYILPEDGRPRLNGVAEKHPEYRLRLADLDRMLQAAA